MEFLKAWFMIKGEKPYIYRNKLGKAMFEKSCIEQWFDEHPFLGIIKVIFFWGGVGFLFTRV